MKKLIIGIAIGALAVLAFTAIPILAHGSTDEGQATVSDQETWDNMHEVCEQGDWDAMAEAAEQYHEENSFESYHDEYDDYEGTSGFGGMMGGHTGNWGGMMSW